MAGNKALGDAKSAKKDEFYTQLCDIEAELRHYTRFFKGKSVLCNCDDPYESNFFYYFASRFNDLGLRKLVATCYDGSPVAYTQLDLFDAPKPRRERRAYKIVITEVGDENGDGTVDIADVECLVRNRKNVLSLLDGNGDFRSPECVALLDEADVVVTNPPFSLFREYLSLLVQHKKKFLIIGPQNAIHYKEVFPLIRDNEMWLGYGFNNGNAFFSIPNGDSRDFADGVYDPATGLVKFRNCAWFTNLDTTKRHEEMILTRALAEGDYPKYDNFDAIDVANLDDIPKDYDGLMGVPDTFLTKYNPDQFEIIGIGSGYLAKQIGVGKNYRGRTDIAYTIDGKPRCPYSRIIIRRKMK